MEDSQLLQIYRFKPGSNLHQYLAKHSLLATIAGCNASITFYNTDYTLMEVMLVLRTLVKEFKLFDDQNPLVLVFDQEAELALDVKAIHVIDTGNRILRQMDPVFRFQEDSPLLLLLSKMAPAIFDITRRNYLETEIAHYFKQCLLSEGFVAKFTFDPPAALKKPAQTLTTSGPFKFAVWGSGEAKAVKAKLSYQLSPACSGKRYRMSPRLFQALEPFFAQRSPELSAIRTYSWGELVRKTTIYIMEHKDAFFDLRSISVAHVQGDPLGLALGVSYFHRSQLVALLKAETEEAVPSLNLPPPAILSQPNDESGSPAKRGRNDNE